MRIFIQPFKLIVLTSFIVFLHLPQSARADGDEDYYKEIRKLKKFEPETLDRIKRETIDAEQIKKANELSRQNSEHNRQVDINSKKIKEPQADPNEGQAPKTGPKGELAGAPRAGKSSGKSTSATASKEVASKSAANKPDVSKTKKISTPSAPSAPVDVKHDTPDELNFPGTGEEDKVEN